MGKFKKFVLVTILLGMIFGIFWMQGRFDPDRMEVPERNDALQSGESFEINPESPRLMSISNLFTYPSREVLSRK